MKNKSENETQTDRVEHETVRKITHKYKMKIKTTKKKKKKKNCNNNNNPMRCAYCLPTANVHTIFGVYYLSIAFVRKSSINDIRKFSHE